MALPFLDRCIFQPTTGGAGTWTVNNAVTGYLTPAQAGAVDATLYYYAAQTADLSQWEIGVSTYTVAGTTAARTRIIANSSGTTVAINFSSVPNVSYGCLLTDGAQFLQNYLSGLGLANSGGDPTNDIDIATGCAADSTNSAMMTLASALTKQLDAAWAVGTNAGGLDTGSIANTTYHVFLIRRSDTGVVDALFSTSASSPTMPANYDRKRRIGSIVRTGGSIKAFVQDGDLFMWKSPANDIDVTNPGTGAVTRTLTLPIGLRIQAHLSALLDNTANPANVGTWYISDLSLTDVAATYVTGGGSGAWYYAGAAAEATGAGNCSVMTNTSGQVRSRLQSSDASSRFIIMTLGWTDRRSRDG